MIRRKEYFSSARIGIGGLVLAVDLRWMSAPHLSRQIALKRYDQTRRKRMFQSEMRQLLQLSLQRRRELPSCKQRSRGSANEILYAVAVAPFVNDSITVETITS